MTTYTVRVGTDYAAWLAGSDGPMAGNQPGITDNGDGSVTLDKRSVRWLRELPTDYDGHIDEAMELWIEGDPYPVEQEAL